MSRNWLDKFLNDEAAKIARTIRASYIDHVARLYEGRSTKYSTVDAALDDFATRLGLNKNELESIKKEAQVKIAQKSTLEKLKDEGLDNPKAVKFMAKSKNKHTDDTMSPFSLNPEKGKALLNEIEEKQKQKPDIDESSQKNELSGTASLDRRIKYLQKLAQEFGKILPFTGAPSKETIEDLKRELGTELQVQEAPETTYSFNFTAFDSKSYPQPNKPVKAKIFRYVTSKAIKAKLVRIINEDLREHLKKELPISEWKTFIQSQVSGGQMSSLDGSNLVQKLDSLERAILGTPTSEPKLVDTTKPRAKTIKQLKEILPFFPRSYQEKILRMLAEGRYRNLLAEGAFAHEDIFSTGYARASFILMSSFAPFKAITFKGIDKDKLKLLLETIVKNRKQEYSNEEFKSLLGELGITYDEVPTKQEAQELRLHSKIRITVDNAKNDGYKPLEFKEEATNKESLLESFHDHIFDALRNKLPLAYETQPDGAQRELYLDDLGDTKKDFTLSTIPHEDAQGKITQVENPSAGMHKSFEGQFSPKEAPRQALSLPEGTAEFSDVQPKQKPKLKTTEKPTETPPEDSFKKLFEEMQKNKAKGLKNISSVMRILEKYATGGLWMDIEGKGYDSEAQLKQSLSMEALEKIGPEIIDEAVKSAMSEIGTAQLPTPEKTKKIEEEQIPLAANTVQKLRTVVSRIDNPNLQKKLQNLVTKL